MSSPAPFPARDCHLQPGDLLGLAAPASSTPDPARIPAVISQLEQAGFRVRPGRHLHERNGYLAGTDAQRAADLQELFADPEVRAIFALRGGYGSCRILPLLDYEAMARQPKPLIGYSDNTALQLALFARAGIVSLHGPNANEAFRSENEAALRRVLLGPLAEGLLLSPARTPGVATARGGAMIGRLLGGNLTCLTRLLGTPYAPDFTGAILFLEDVNEKAYRLDGLFTHLRLSGVWAKLGGLIFGRFDHPDAAEQARLADFLRQLTDESTVPTLIHAPIGHDPAQITVPVGARVQLDATARTLTWL